MAREREGLPESALNSLGQYRWKHGDLPTRLPNNQTCSAFNRYFQIPPKEFVFLNRKLVGVYTFISVLDAEFNGAPIFERFLKPFSARLIYGASRAGEGDGIGRAIKAVLSLGIFMFLGLQRWGIRLRRVYPLQGI